MSVSAEYDIDQDQIERMNLTLSITMTVAEWRKVEGQLHCSQSAPPSQLMWAIDGALGNVRDIASKKYRFPQP